MCRNCWRQQTRRINHGADSSSFKSILDNPPQLMRSGKQHGPGIILLGMFKDMPIAPYIDVATIVIIIMIIPPI